jgi:hypothetical protein
MKGGQYPMLKQMMKNASDAMVYKNQNPIPEANRKRWLDSVQALKEALTELQDDREFECLSIN